MRKVPVITADQAAAMIPDNCTVTSSGFVASCMAEALTKAVEKRYLETGSPKNLTLVYAAAQGNRDGSGADHFAHEGLIKRVVGGHYNMAPKIGEMILTGKIEGYNFPQGTISQWFRDLAGHKPGTITHVGMGTFADPRVEGGKLNDITTEDLVEVIDVLGEEKLIYKTFPVDFALIRGTYADETGNITVEKEVASTEVTAIAQAVKNSGGKVIVQVEEVKEAGSLDPKLVKIPGIFVDAVVIAEDPKDHEQCRTCEWDGSMSGQFRADIHVDASNVTPLDAKKIIARRGALELVEGSVVNLGIGAPEFVATVANEEGIGDYMTMTVEAGAVGGIPQGGPKFGGSVNPDSILDQNVLFDFYDGGGIDNAYLGLAEADSHGNINVSKFGPRLAGCGGFINITQNAKRVFFCGTFTAGGLKTQCQDGKLVILQEGKNIKLLKDVEQITFSGDYARKVGQPVMYITERAVFELKEDGMHLTEVAPGIDIKTQILDLMEFEPIIDGQPKLMDERIFKEELMGLSK